MVGSSAGFPLTHKHSIHHALTEKQWSILFCPLIILAISLIRLRILSGIGALIYILYGILIEAYPVAILNGIIFFIDLYFLIQMLKRRDYFTLMSVEPGST